MEQNYLRSTLQPVSIYEAMSELRELCPVCVLLYFVDILQDQRYADFTSVTMTINLKEKSMQVHLSSQEVPNA